MNHADHDDIDRLLASEARITPSPQFLASVMRAVEREAASRPPLAFPWRRALPGFIAVVVAVAAAIRYALDLLGDPAAIDAFNAQLGQAAAIAGRFELHWIALAIAATVVSLTLASGLAPGRRHA